MYIHPPISTGRRTGSFDSAVQDLTFSRKPGKSKDVCTTYLYTRVCSTWVPPVEAHYGMYELVIKESTKNLRFDVRETGWRAECGHDI